MKKNIFLLLSAVLLLACGTRKKSENKSVGLKRYTAYYNTLFNSKDALQTEVKNRKQAHQDNFYEPYISILTEEDQPVGSEIGGPASVFNESENFSRGVPKGPSNATSILQIAEAKAQKTIAKYSVMKDGVEKNKTIFDAYIMLAQAKLYQNKPLEALDALNYLFTNMKKDKRIDLAKIYQAQAFAKMGDYYRSNEIFRSLNDLSKSYDRLKTVYYSEMLVNSGKKEEAVAELENAFNANKNRQLRSRIAFLRGQVLASMGKNEEARESFATAYKYANDFQFEVRSQVEIAKTFRRKNDDYESAKKYLESISKKGTYAARKNEFYYSLGIMANEAGKKEEAQEYFRLALKEKMSDPQLRGLTYYEIGKDYFNQNDYIAAGAYYDSAVAVMTYQPSRAELSMLSSNIKNITKNFYLIKKNDSVLALTKMPAAEREAYFTKYIDVLKAKEAQQLAAKAREERSKGFDTGDYDANSVFANAKTGFQDFSSGSRGGFYFANQGTVSRGQADFKQIWGSRSSQDNWRYSSRTATLEDMRNESMGLASAQDPRRFDPSFYIEQLPTDPREIEVLKKDRDTASLGLGRMYQSYFNNTPLATKTLYDLVDSQPEEDIKLQALYQIFAMNYETNPAAAERAKNLIISDFPYTSYAEFVRNPKNTEFSKSSSEVVSAYNRAFDFYNEGKFDESKALIEESLTKYPKDALVPKFALLNAYNAGKTAGKEIMILQLEQLALNYARTPEGEKARSILDYLKSDLQVQYTDAQGNAVAPATSTAVAPTERVPAQIHETSRVIEEEATRPVPEINTTENVVKPLQNNTMPTSPPVKPGQNSVPKRPPGGDRQTGVGMPETAPELRKLKER